MYLGAGGWKPGIEGDMKEEIKNMMHNERLKLAKKISEFVKNDYQLTSKDSVKSENMPRSPKIIGLTRQNHKNPNKNKENNLQKNKDLENSMRHNEHIRNRRLNKGKDLVDSSSPTNSVPTTIQTDDTSEPNDYQTSGQSQPGQTSGQDRPILMGGNDYYQQYNQKFNGQHATQPKKEGVQQFKITRGGKRPKLSNIEAEDPKVKMRKRKKKIPEIRGEIVDKHGLMSKSEDSSLGNEDSTKRTEDFSLNNSQNESQRDPKKKEIKKKKKSISKSGKAILDDGQTAPVNEINENMSENSQIRSENENISDHDQDIQTPTQSAKTQQNIKSQSAKTLKSTTSSQLTSPPKSQISKKTPSQKSAISPVASNIGTDSHVTDIDQDILSQKSPSKSPVKADQDTESEILDNPSQTESHPSNTNKSNTKSVNQDDEEQEIGQVNPSQSSKKSVPKDGEETESRSVQNSANASGRTGEPVEDQKTGSKSQVLETDEEDVAQKAVELNKFTGIKLDKGEFTDLDEDVGIAVGASKGKKVFGFGVLGNIFYFT